MSKIDSTSPSAQDKPPRPAKPRPDFPLGYHPAGYWCKKIRGKLHYFGPRSDAADPVAPATAADAALTEYNQQADALHSGRKPRPDPEALTVKDIVNAFLNEKQTRVDTGELSRRTWRVYKESCDEIIAGFGKTRLVADLGADD